MWYQEEGHWTACWSPPQYQDEKFQLWLKREKQKQLKGCWLWTALSVEELIGNFKYYNKSSGLHFEGLYSAYVSTCPSSSVSSSSASSSSSGGNWVLWGWKPNALHYSTQSFTALIAASGRFVSASLKMSQWGDWNPEAGEQLGRSWAHMHKSS